MSEKSLIDEVERGKEADQIMSGAKGGLFISFEFGRGEGLRAAARSKDRFSVELSTLDWQVDRKEMFLMCFSNDRTQIECAAIGRHKRGPRNTAGFNIEFMAFVFFDPIDISNLLEPIPPRARATIKQIEGNRGKRFPPEAWHAVLEVIKRARSNIASQLGSLWTRVIAKDDPEPATHVQRLALQRDAIGLSFDIAGLSDTRRQVFRKVQPVSNTAQASSFVRLMEVQPPQERMLLDHDRSVLEGIIAEGKSESAIFSEGPRHLRVWTVDKGPVERFAGVDLVILNQDYNSLLLLQYKCMELTYTRRAQTWRYRPDDQFDIEMERMKKVRRLIHQHTPVKSSMEDIRLHRGALYFKFCKRLPLSQQDGELADGMFMSLSSTEAILKSQDGQGEEEARIIGYDVCERYLNNSLFAALARDGWIGSRGLSDQSYKEVLGLVQEREGHSMVLAETHTSIPPDAPRASRRWR